MLGALVADVDLDARGISIPDGMDVATLCAAASAAIRDAAGCPISQATSTITLVVVDPCEIDLPAGPVTAVASVELDSVAVTGWRRVGDVLLMPYRWLGTDCLPVEVSVTYTHGLPVVPQDIVDLACGLVAIAAGQNGDYGGVGRTQSIRLGDYGETFMAQPGGGFPSPVTVPESVRCSLRSRFGTNVAVLRTH